LPFDSAAHSSCDNGAPADLHQRLHDTMASRQLRTLERGILCVLIGAAVLLGPRFLQGTRWFEMVAGASVVGWFALALGVALIVVDLVQRAKARR